MPSFHERFSRFYRNATTSRGLTYRYLAIPALNDSKPVLVFLHGYPCSSYDWVNQICYFQEKGYGIIVPDMLGFGGTDKPADPGEFRLKLLAQDVVEIVDKENPQPARAVAIAHDWGSVVLSRIAMYHSTRFVAYAWLAFGFLPPTPATGPIDLEIALSWLKQTVGVELFAYQEFLLKPEAAKLMETNIDSLIDMSFPEKAEHWQETMTTRGGMEDWITNNKRGPRASWLTDEYVQEFRQNLLRGGFDSPLNYYRCFMGPWNIDDENKLVETLETFSVAQPVFFGPALRDYVGLPSIQTPATQAVAKDLTIVEFDTGHWVYLELPDKVNQALDAWLSSKGLEFGRS